MDQDLHKARLPSHQSTKHKVCLHNLFRNYIIYWFIVAF